VIIKLFSDGSANLNMGASDLGTGTKTVMAWLFRGTGVPLQKIRLSMRTRDDSVCDWQRRQQTVPTESPAVRAAAVDVKQQLLEMAGRETQNNPLGSCLQRRRDRSWRILRKRSRRPTFLSSGGGASFWGWLPRPQPGRQGREPFAAQFCEVEVNTKTGEVRVLRFLSANDSGRVMNRLTYDNQVFGGITMGIGLGMTEKRILDGNQTGKTVTRNWHDYKIPTALDVPADMSCVPIDMGIPWQTRQGPRDWRAGYRSHSTGHRQCRVSRNRDQGYRNTHQPDTVERIAWRSAGKGDEPWGCRTSRTSSPVSQGGD